MVSNSDEELALTQEATGDTPTPPPRGAPAGTTIGRYGLERELAQAS